ncbi:MAG: hypothetical protein ABI451_08245 [Dokdonella sp.]
MANDVFSGSRDFDFFFGRWHVRNERLKQRLVGSTDWEHFEATQECRPILGGIGNIDDFITDWGGTQSGGGFVGMSLRLFNPATQLWSIYWAGNRDGVLQPPVDGRFRDDVGRFEGRDTHAGVPVLARFIWSEITPTSAKWEQAFSVDEGVTWETNWIMRMTRIASSDEGST